MSAFIARLAALVPKPRVNLTRFHGVLAPNHRYRGEVTPARRGKAPKTGVNAKVRTPATLPLFAGKETVFSQFNQQGRH